MAIIIFDYDGVIVDSTDMTIGLFTMLHERFGTPPCKTKEDLIPFYNTNVFDYFLEHGLDKNKLPELLDAIPEYIQNHQDQATIHPGIPQLLAELAKQHHIYIISSNFTKPITDKLNQANLSPYITEVLGADKGTSKVDKINKIKTPHADKKTYYIGDTVGDIKEAHDANVTAIAAAWGYHPRDVLEPSNPDLICDTPKELLNALR